MGVAGFATAVENVGVLGGMDGGENSGEGFCRGKEGAVSGGFWREPGFRTDGGRGGERMKGEEWELKERERVWGGPTLAGGIRLHEFVLGACFSKFGG